MSILQNKLKKLPDAPGIYLFYNSKKELLYVGKASSLKARVRSYFSGAKTPKSLMASGQASRPIEQMIHQVTNIKHKETDSVLEAIILEANYIKKYQPKYNVDGKDDKSWNYIVITKDEYPRVKTLRAHELANIRITNDSNVRMKDGDYLHVFGPFPGLKTREMLRLLQRLFYISTCKPNAKRPCLYREMGQCLGVCTGEISSAQYKQKVIRPLVTFLRGGKKRLIKSLEVKMKKAAKVQEFEEAARLRNQISALKKIQDIALLNKSFIETPAALPSVVSTPPARGSDYPASVTFRVEGYDISNLGSSGKVGSMVVFVDGEPDKKQYRKFNIKTVKGQSDVDCLAEILERRFKHLEWHYPDIVLVDGGKPQVNRAKKVLEKFLLDIPVVGIAKGKARKKNEFIGLENLKPYALDLKPVLIRVRDEAHRFAIKFQRSKRKIKR